MILYFSPTSPPLLCPCFYPSTMALWPPITLDVSRQLSGVTRSSAYGNVAVNEENRFQMCLESLTRLNKVKHTNVNRIEKTYLTLRGNLNTEIYGFIMYKRAVSIATKKTISWLSGVGTKLWSYSLSPGCTPTWTVSLESDPCGQRTVCKIWLWKSESLILLAIGQGLRLLAVAVPKTESLKIDSIGVSI